MSQRKEHLDALAMSLLLACCIFWGFQQVLIKATLPSIAPVFQAALRFAGATILLWFWCLARGEKLFEKDGSLAAGLLAGGLFAAEFACLYSGLQFTSASRLTVFLYTAPFWVALVVPFFVRSERLNLIQWLGLLLAFVSVVFALREGFVAPEQERAWLGDLLAISGGMFWGLTTVTIRSTRLAHVTAGKLLFYQVGVGALVLPALSLWLGESWRWDFDQFSMISLFLQTVVGAFASYLTLMWLLGRYPATKISVFVFLTPMFALLFGSLWLGERITSGLLMALIGVALGIVLVNRRRTQ